MWGRQWLISKVMENYLNLNSSSSSCSRNVTKRRRTSVPSIHTEALHEGGFSALWTVTYVSRVKRAFGLGAAEEYINLIITGQCYRHCKVLFLFSLPLPSSSAYLSPLREFYAPETPWWGKRRVSWTPLTGQRHVNVLCRATRENKGLAATVIPWSVKNTNGRVSTNCWGLLWYTCS